MNTLQAIQAIDQVSLAMEFGGGFTECYMVREIEPTSL